MTEADRERYSQPGQATASPVKLECASCHQTDSADFRIPGDHVAGIPSGVFAKRTSGAYMVPITYEVL